MNIAQYLEHSQVSQSAFAALVGVSQSMVWQWIEGRRPVPEKRCARIERLTNGAITRQELRPDDWQEIWPELANTEGKGGGHA